MKEFGAKRSEGEAGVSREENGTDEAILQREPVTVYFGLGSNLGDKAEALRRAREALAALPGTRLEAASRIYRTAPVGKTDQDWFLNQVVRGTTRLSPDDLLRRTLRIEANLGRVREVRWGPRTIDIDILVYGDVHRSDPHLTLPHPRITERAFVLVPLAELAPEMVIEGKSVADHLAALPDSARRDVVVADA